MKILNYIFLFSGIVFVVGIYLYVLVYRKLMLNQPDPLRPANSNFEFFCNRFYYGAIIHLFKAKPKDKEDANSYLVHRNWYSYSGVERPKRSFKDFLYALAVVGGFLLWLHSILYVLFDSRT